MDTQNQVHLGNLLGDLPVSGEQEDFQTLLNQPHVRIERIVSHGHTSPAEGWYDQAEDEWILLVSGTARLQFESGGKEIELNQGDYLNIPAHCRHRVSWTDPDQPTIWLAVHASSP